MGLLVIAILLMDGILHYHSRPGQDQFSADSRFQDWGNFPPFRQFQEAIRLAQGIASIGG
jgi:hypothetical protein